MDDGPVARKERSVLAVVTAVFVTATHVVTIIGQDKSRADSEDVTPRTRAVVSPKG